jgi:hypothetical protein
MVIYMLRGWPFASEIEDKTRKAFINTVISKFNIVGDRKINGEVTRVELEGDIIKKYLE